MKAGEVTGIKKTVTLMNEMLVSITVQQDNMKPSKSNLTEMQRVSQNLSKITLRDATG